MTKNTEMKDLQWRTYHNWKTHTTHIPLGIRQSETQVETEIIEVTKEAVTEEGVDVYSKNLP